MVELPISKGHNRRQMTTACPCFGRNENCRFCGGSGFVSSESEVKVVRHMKPTYLSGQTETQQRVEAGSKKTSKDNSSKQERLRAAIYQAAAERRRLDSAQEAQKIRDAAERQAKTPEGQLASKLKKERDMKLAAEQAIQDAEQAAKSIAYWNKRWGKS